MTLYLHIQGLKKVSNKLIRLVVSIRMIFNQIITICNLTIFNSSNPFENGIRPSLKLFSNRPDRPTLRAKLYGVIKFVIGGSQP